MKVRGSVLLAITLIAAPLPLAALATGTAFAQAPAKPASAKPAAAKSAAAKATAAKPAAGPRTITIGATDAMKFDPATITAKPGEKLLIVLKPAGTMPKIAMSHNFIILKPGSNEAKFAEASATERPDFIAPALKSQVLVATTLAGNGETVSAEFTAPAKPGSYTFFCTFPGHFVAGMKGVLVVK
jgi:azurin